MEKARNASVWTEEGYTLFAKEGIEGVQVERLARILKLNKSGFYHYFGDRAVFCEQLLILHEKKANDFFNDCRQVKTIDPEYLHVLVKHAIPILFQIQLVRSNNNPVFKKLAETIDQNEDLILREVWTDYIGFHDNPDLAIRYFNIVRDMFYTRLSLDNLNYQFLHNLMREANDLAKEIVRQSNLATNDMLN